MFTYTQTQTVKYSLTDVIKYTTNLVIATPNRIETIRTKVKHTKPCLNVISTFIKANRWDMLGTYDGYKIILNGYGEFKEIVTNSGKIYKAQEIFNKMRILSV